MKDIGKMKDFTKASMQIYNKLCGACRARMLRFHLKGKKMPYNRYCDKCKKMSKEVFDKYDIPVNV